ncbi:MAG TPA: PAS domain S-box protein, partial [Candidatus Dormibacteraeota bacterium]|nr:PAS domain S-box protein [Candidatus Dormibacteraeota bacterium]
MSSTDPTAIPAAAVRLLLSTNPLPMWIYDLETLRFLEVNQAAIRHYGYSRAEFLQRRITDIRPADDLEELHRDLSTPRAPFQTSGPWQHQTADGRLLAVLVSSHLLTWEGRPAAFVTAEPRPGVPSPSRSPMVSADPLLALPDDAALIPRTAAALARMGITGAVPAVLILGVDTAEDVIAGLGTSGFSTLLRQLVRRLAPYCSGSYGLHRLGSTR